MLSPAHMARFGGVMYVLDGVLWIALGLIFFIGTLLLLVTRRDWFPFFPFGLGGAVMVAAVLFESYVYNPTIDSSAGRWQVTDERFVDPSTGRTMEVLYNPDTGQRTYREPESSSSTL